MSVLQSKRLSFDKLSAFVAVGSNVMAMLIARVDTSIAATFLLINALEHFVRKSGGNISPDLTSA